MGVSLAWLLLAGAILTEVSATIFLKLAVEGRLWWYMGVGVGYILAFGLFAACIAAGLGIGVAYGVWTAVGIVATTVMGRIIFAEVVSPLMGFGMTLIVAGVILVELGTRW